LSLGPVRSCAFHPTQPIFATCGDDNKVRVFNFQQKKLLFVLTGHQDYIRSVTFHHESPWLMTASDDQTIRIWNWQSRSCVAQLTGHSHYVMCAAFHPKEDLVVSASLDQTIRVWDISYLKRKGSATPMDEPRGGAGQIDLFATSDGQVKFVLEGHDRGVNWVSFHPTKPLIVSGSDDRSIRLWRFNDSRAWETDCFRGHLNNVSCVVFHPTLDLILSASEDRTVRVWDYGKKGGSAAVSTFRRDTERYWMLAVHPTLGMFAAGHDGGLQLFKLERERPPQLVLGESLYFVRGAALMRRDLSQPTGTETALVTLASLPVLPASLDYSPEGRAFLVSSGSEYDLIGRTSRHGIGAFALFLGGGLFIVLDVSAQQLHLRSVSDGSQVGSLALPISAVERLFPAPNGAALLCSSSLAVLFDPQHKAVLAELEISKVKRVSWSPDGSRCALLSRKSIVYTDGLLNALAQVTEHVAVKSAVWESTPLGMMLFYTTPHHLKYMLPSRETGIVCTTDNPIYLVRVSGGNVSALDRSAQLVSLQVDPAEWQFKLALLAGDLPRCLVIISGSTSIVGQSVIGYLREHGYAALALRFVEDPQARLELALEAADWEVAKEACEALDKPASWRLLGETARRLGHPQVAKDAFEQAGAEAGSNRLLLAAITGDICSLRRSMESSADLSTRIQAALLLGEGAGLAGVLGEAGLSPLAYLAQSRLSQSGKSSHTPPASAELDYSKGATSLRGLKASSPNDSTWPLSRALFDFDVPPTPPAEEQQRGHGMLAAAVGMDANKAGGAWEQDEFSLSHDAIGGDEEFAEFAAAEDNPLLATRVPALHLLAGSVESAKQLLSQQAGIKDFKPMAPLFALFAQTAAVGQFVNRFEDLGRPPVTRSTLQASLEMGLQLTTEGRFSDAITTFESVLQAAPLALLEADEASVEPLMNEARDYLVGLHMELARKELLGRATTAGGELPPATASRVLELACYFACCHLRTPHRILSARSAMTLAFRLKQWSLAARMARRLLDLQPDEAIAAQAQKVLTASSQQSSQSTQYLEVRFDDMLDFDLDPAQHLPLYPGQPNTACPLCGALYADFSAGTGKTCRVCRVATVGASATGLQLTL